MVQNFLRPLSSAKALPVCTHALFHDGAAGSFADSRCLIPVTAAFFHPKTLNIYLYTITPTFPAIAGPPHLRTDPRHAKPGKPVGKSRREIAQTGSGVRPQVRARRDVADRIFRRKIPEKPRPACRIVCFGMRARRARPPACGARKIDGALVSEALFELFANVRGSVAVFRAVWGFCDFFGGGFAPGALTRAGGRVTCSGCVGGFDSSCGLFCC